MVFCATAADIRPLLETSDPPSLREIDSWEDLPVEVQQRIENRGEDFYWGEREWFARGWRLGIGLVRNDVVIFGWWRNASQSRNFFCPLPENAELLWHMFCLPEFRGHNYQAQFLIVLMRERLRHGVASFYINCRDYNVASHRNILKAGFRRIGHCTINRISRRRRWRSANKWCRLSGI